MDELTKMIIVKKTIPELQERKTPLDGTTLKRDD